MKRFGELVSLVLLVVLGMIVLSVLLGQPMLVGYVTTESMEPTISAGDGFITVPVALASQVEEGDVIVYDASEMHAGGLTTHRVIGVTDDGYITQGDANPFTDQDAGEPPVSDDQVVAKVLQIGETVVVIPHFGTVVVAVQSSAETLHDRLDTTTIGIAITVIGAILVMLALLWDLRQDRRSTVRQISRQNVIAVGTLVIGGIVVVTGVATYTMVAPAGVHEYTIISTTAPSAEPGVIQQGHAGEIVHEVTSQSIIPILVRVESNRDDITVSPETTIIRRGSTEKLTVTILAPDERGTYHRYVTEYRYLVVLPPTILLWLHSIHPYLALVAVNGTFAVIVSVLMVVLFGRDHLRIRTPGDHIPWTIRARRRIERTIQMIIGDDK